MRNIYILLVLAFQILGLEFATAQKDSLILKSVKCFPDTLFNGVRGIGISYHAILGYDTTFHQQKSPTETKLKINLKSNKKRVNCNGSSYKYCDKNQVFQYIKDLRFDFGRKEIIFIPFYILELNEGLNTVEIELSALMSDTSIFDSALKTLKIIGESRFEIQFNKPQIEEFSVLVSGVKFMETDFKGKPWDYNLLSGAAPDICWKVTVGAGDNYDALYCSPVMKNSYSAAWLDWAENITLSKGDKFSISLYDDDPASDDFAGSLYGTLPQIIEKSTQKQPMVFDRLTYFTFMINKIK
ncbi:MAG: hypothetical protein WCP69_14845 [Bacteroidota bacterium]